MAAVPDVTITAGVPTAGTGTVSTLDKFDSAAGVSATRALTVQGIGSGTPMPVSMASVPSHAVTNAGTFVTQENGPALTAMQLLDDNMVAPGTAIGSTKNALIGGSVTTAAPTYTTGQVSPLNLDTAGNLRVNVAAGGGSGGTSSTVNSAAPSTATAIGFTDGTNMQLGVIKAASTAPVATDRAIVVAVSPNSQNANGTTTDANSTPVAWSTEGKAQIGSVTETAPASDTASSGLNGRLQRIAQNLSAVTLVDDAAFTPATSKVLMNGYQADETSTDSVDEGDAGAARMTLDRKQIVTTQPHTQGGATTIRKIDLDEAPSVVKASRGQLYGFYIVNRTTSARYLRFYNVAAGSVTVGTTAALVGPIEIPANASDHTALIINFPYGIEFDTAMSWAVTTGFADNDTGAPGANDILANAFIK